jgi:hypothetical protein
MHLQAPQALFCLFISKERKRSIHCLSKTVTLSYESGHINRGISSWKEAKTAEAGADERCIVENICRDWLQLELVSGQDKSPGMVLRSAGALLGTSSY